MSVTVGFLALLEAKPHKADELAAFLEQGRELALAEPLTVDWYAFRIDQFTYGIFDTFEAEAGREAHRVGEISKALMAAAPELLAKDPDVRPVDVIAVKCRPRRLVPKLPDAISVSQQELGSRSTRGRRSPCAADTQTCLFREAQREPRTSSGRF